MDTSFNFPVISIVPDSFQEYPGHHSLVLFCGGCNFSCPECYNLNSLSNDPIGDGKILIEKNLTPMHNAVVFLGGEPTLYSYGLQECCKAARERKQKTKIYTNGQRSEVIEKLASRFLLNSLSVDLKGIKNISKIVKTSIQDDIYLTNVDIVVSLGLAYRIDLEIRTPIWNSNKNQIVDIKAYVAKRYPKVRHILQDKFEIK